MQDVLSAMLFKKMYVVYLNAGIANILCLVPLWESGESYRPFLRKRFQMHKLGILSIRVFYYFYYIQTLKFIHDFAAYIRYWMKTNYQFVVIEYMVVIFYHPYIQYPWNLNLNQFGSPWIPGYKRLSSQL
jgi:hypothetical protein